MIRKDMTGRQCQVCHRTNTYLARRKFEQWYYFDANKDSFMCYKCYQRIVQHPRYYKQHRKHIRAVQRDYYYRVTKPRNDRMKQLISIGVEKN
jgi:hypothetical protein